MAINPFFNPVMFISEIIYAIIVFFICFLIYYKTKDSYNLTKHKGIMFFRDAFLFFGLAYILRFIFALVRVSSNTFDFFIPRYTLFPVVLFILGYLSTVGIFYLIFSFTWKRIKGKYFIPLSHIIAVFISIVAFSLRSHHIILYIQTGIIALAIILSFVVHTKQRKISQTRILYLLIFLFWLINLWLVIPRRFFTFEVKIIFQIVSIAIFLFVYYKVLKWLK